MASLGAVSNLFVCSGTPPTEGCASGAPPPIAATVDVATAFQSILTSLIPDGSISPTGLATSVMPEPGNGMPAAQGDSASQSPKTHGDFAGDDVTQTSLAIAIFQTFYAVNTVPPPTKVGTPDGACPEVSDACMPGFTASTTDETLARPTTVNSPSPSGSVIAKLDATQLGEQNEANIRHLPLEPLVAQAGSESAFRGMDAVSDFGDSVDATKTADRAGTTNVAALRMTVFEPDKDEIAADGTVSSGAAVGTALRDPDEPPMELDDASDESYANSVSAEGGDFRSHDYSSHPMLDTVTSAKFVRQVSEHFEMHLDQLRQQGRVELRMDLHPPELGQMKMHLTMEDNQVNVRMVVQDDAAKRALDQQLEPMRLHFTQIGVNLGQLDVRQDGNRHTNDPEQTMDFETASARIRRTGSQRMPSAAAPPSESGSVDIVA